MKNKVSSSAGAIGNTAVTSMQKSLSKVSDVMLGDFDMAPTIRPVIDMSDVENGLNSTFSKEQSLNVGEIKGRAAAVATATHQNGTSSDLGDTSIDNSNYQQIQISPSFIVRNDSDIQKINRGLDNIVSKFNRTKGVPVTS